MAIRILLVDDEPLILKGLRFSLQQEGYEIDQAADGEEALSKILHNTYDLILLDVMLPRNPQIFRQTHHHAYRQGRGYG